jgi:ribonucleoside-diphosphate reductase alpha chain
MLGRDYGAADSAGWAGAMMARFRDAAYRASCALAREKGPFPAYAREPFLASAFVQRLPPGLRAAIAHHGLRNSHLLAIAPAGTISLLAGNVSSGIEPIFQASHRRHVRRADGSEAVYEIEDHACRRWRELGRPGLPPGYRAASELPPEAHIAMQAAVQAAVDNAVAKTVNVPADIDRGAFAALFEHAYAAGLKGLTVYRPAAVRGAILEPSCAVI